MVNAMVDSSIIIDLLRKYPNANRWLAQQNDILGVNLYVWLEVIEGAQNKIDQQRAVKLLNSFDLVDIHAQDVNWAMAQLTRVNLSHNVDSFDCLIAASAQRHNILLYTRNIKHFRPLLGELAKVPY